MAAVAANYRCIDAISWDQKQGLTRTAFGFGALFRLSFFGFILFENPQIGTYFIIHVSSFE